MDLMVLKNYFKDKKVLITGNTGFKGSWLTLFLQNLDAEVFGLSASHKITNIFSLSDNKQYYADINNYNKVSNIISAIKPDIIFHLAAQAITLSAHEKPLKTFQTNVMGTLNVLESLRNVHFNCNAVIITSDKCYSNKEWIWGYRENDELGGADPYSASKSMAELAVKSYYLSYFKDSALINVATCRSGNVIGGGDWGEHRIIPDCIRAWTQKKPIEIRNPDAIRPWNYILDTIYGYILTAYHLEKNKINGESFNFGPNNRNTITVKKLVETLWENWDDKKLDPYSLIDSSSNKIEHTNLNLYSEKALSILQWKSKTDICESIAFTAKWYRMNNQNADMKKYSEELTINYLNVLN